MNAETWESMFRRLGSVERARVALTESPLAFDWGRFDGCPDVAEFVNGGGIAPTVPDTLRRFAAYRWTAPVGGVAQAVDLRLIAQLLDEWLRAEVPL